MNDTLKPTEVKGYHNSTILRRVRGSEPEWRRSAPGSAEQDIASRSERQAGQHDRKPERR